jgi:hypothetical protein
MKKNLLYITLIIAFVIEAALTILCFFKPITAMGLFGMVYSSETSFLVYIIAWFCLLVSILIIYALIGLKNNNNGYKILIYILGYWWIGLGIGVFVSFKKTDNLLLDSLKGFILVVLNYLYAKEKRIKL